MATHRIIVPNKWIDEATAVLKKNEGRPTSQWYVVGLRNLVQDILEMCQEQMADPSDT